jgi:hypothetical protein
MLTPYFQKKTIEVRDPAPGQRHNTETIYVSHRFPVVNGITPEELLRIQYSQTNKFYGYVKKGRA